MRYEILPLDLPNVLCYTLSRKRRKNRMLGVLETDDLYSFIIEH